MRLGRCTGLCNTITFYFEHEQDFRAHIFNSRKSIKGGKGYEYTFCRNLLNHPNSMEQYPFQNLSIANIPGEHWKTIQLFEGLEDLYEVSDHGRIKSLPRKRFSRQGKAVLIKERIRKQHLGTVLNKAVNLPLYTLLITLIRDGLRINVSVGRLVYYYFVEPFDLSDKSILISYKDGDGRNLHLSNLVKSDISRLSLDSAQKGRAISALRKPVNQFTPEGLLVNSYQSMYEAASKTGFTHSAIAAVATGKNLLYKGFSWQFGEMGVEFKEGRLLKYGSTGINNALMHRLGLKVSDIKDIPAYLDLSLQERRGERWKAIPGYEASYQISDHGRVKSLKRISTGKNQKWVPEAIKSLYCSFRSGSDKTAGTLKVMLAGEKGKTGICVGRMVYYLFVAEFDLANKNLRVYCRDGNPLHVMHKNLVLKNGIWSVGKIG